MSRTDDIACELDVNPRWLPPQEHAEKILEWVEEGRCHIEHRGHKKAPILVFDDGGAMELPTVRWMETPRGWRLASIGDEHTEQQTSHYDVCGTVDIIEEAIEGEPDLEGLQDLLDDIEHMLRRMKSRRDEYEAFVSGVRKALESEVRRKEVEPAYGWLDELREMLDRPPQEVQEDREKIVEKAEAVREVAQFLEYSLTDFREIALQIHRLYEEVRGARNWSQEENERE
ncbi:MAG: hypothetical protein ACLFWB_03985 [Armatimonadota bacterium]